VQPRPRNVHVYVTASDAVPFDEYLEGLKDGIGRAAIDARIALLRRGSLGNKYEDIEEGLIELKIDTGPGYRVYLADNGKDSLLLCAGSKRTQKQDIKAAKANWQDHKARS
jgi:putative addiction module killer protein